MNSTNKRKFIQWLILPTVIVTILLGWKYPLLGFSVPVVMVMGLVGGIFRGRYVCGNLCPRGAFFDRIISHLSFDRGIPSFFRNKYLRIILFILLMGFMGYRISQNPAEITHWGIAFWLMCVVTTFLGIILGVFLHHRCWCSFCPMGSVQNFLGGKKNQLKIDKEKCIECGLCEKKCPMDLPIVSYKESGQMSDRDCLKCSECINVCPNNALSWPNQQNL